MQQNSRYLEQIYRKVYPLVLFLLCLAVGCLIFWPFWMDLHKLLTVDSIATTVRVEAEQIEIPSTIPKIMHHFSGNSEISPNWVESYTSCTHLHESYQLELWTDKRMRDFIESEYNWFLESFDSYSYHIQRVDAARYFVLYHYGGFYLDLDIGCRTKLDKFRHTRFTGILPRTEPAGISNDVMIFAPRHPFLLYAAHRLILYNTNYIIPYLTILFSTGPVFLSIVLHDYVLKQKNGEKLTDFMDVPEGMQQEGALQEVAVMSASDYNHRFFYHVKGSSWHTFDAKVIIFLYNHCSLNTLIVAVLVACAGAIWITLHLCAGDGSTDSQHQSGRLLSRRDCVGEQVSCGVTYSHKHERHVI